MAKAKFVNSVDGKTKDEILDFVQKIKDRDAKRGIKIGDRMVITSTSNEGFTLMHEKDFFRERGKVYNMIIDEIY